MTYSHEHLLYLSHKESLRNLLGSQVDIFFNWLFTQGLTEQTIIKGTEHIPASAPFVVAIAPHTGIAEVFATDYALRLAQQLPVWMAKKETFSKLPPFIMERRFFQVDRHSFDRRALLISNLILVKAGIVASALEGTRGEETKARSSVTRNERLALQPAQAGLVYIAHQAQVEILPVAIWGPENDALFPFPEANLERYQQQLSRLPLLDPKVIDILSEVGLIGAVLRNLIKPKNHKPQIHIAITKPYSDHLLDSRLNVRKNYSQNLLEHAHRIMLSQIIPALPEDWPLGFYEDKCLDHHSGIQIQFQT